MTPRPHRSARLAAFAAILLLVTACSGTASSPAGPGDGPAATGSGGTGAVETPPGPVATPEILDGIPNDTDLVPPDPEPGDVPPAEPPTAALAGSLALGPAAPVVDGTIDTGGGTLEAPAGSAAAGLAIEVPAGAYAEPVRFVVATSPITATTFDGLAAVSALVSVENGGVVTSGDPVLVTIPVTLPADASPADVVANYYDARAGTLAPLPVVAATATTATVAARHFSDVWLALPDWSKVPAAVDSGFRPGVDDWQFTNYGSFVAPGGHCEGQVMSAMWYYRVQRLGGGASPLYGLYDNNGAGRTSMWQDDSDGYRLASAVQASAIANQGVYSFATGLGQLAGAYAFNAFRAAIWATGEPQLMAIHDSQGGHGHAIIAYRVTKDRIFVADPNYPGRLRTIRYDAATGVLGPYNSGDSAGSIAANGAISYTRFALIPGQASAADGTIAGLWADFTDNASGSGLFPGYALEAWQGLDEQGNDVWAPLENGYKAAEEELRVRLVPAGGEQLSLAIFRGTAAKPEKGWGTDLKLTLKEGENDLGFYVMGVKDGAWRYVDFDRLIVDRGPIDINGSWEGTLTFTDITVDPETLKAAEEEGCTVEFIQELLDLPLPMTLDITADEAGEGSAVMILDPSALGEGVESSDPLEMGLSYADGKITFEFGDACEDTSCAMTATATRKEGKDRVDGVLTIAGTGYSATAEWTVGRAE